MTHFDPRSPLCRSPQGAVATGCQVQLHLPVARNTLPSVSVVVEKRMNYDSKEVQRLNMYWVSAEKDKDIYEASFTVEEPGHYLYYFTGAVGETGVYQLPVYDESDYVQWMPGGIIYHIFVDRFYREKILSKGGKIVIRQDWGGTPNYEPDEKEEILNNDFFGGNLEGITLKLPYLKSLGVTVIYLSPVFEAYSNHKYDTGNYMAVDPMFGDKKALSRLCTEAEKLSMSVILDGVFSHTGSDSIYFNKEGHYNSQGAWQGEDSPYREWYNFNDDPAGYSCWWGIKTLPAINKDCPSYREFITGINGVIAHWMKAGISGWRLDVADELPDSFLREIQDAVRREQSDSVIIGEVWEDAADKYAYGHLKEYFCGHELDSVTNYPLRDAIIDFVKTHDGGILRETMGFICEKYPPDTVNCLMNILGTHDTVRILTELGSSRLPNSKAEASTSVLSASELSMGIERLKVASFLQYTLPGVPCLYYGDEVGLQGWKDPFNRRCYPWGNENKELLNHYKLLNRMRSSSTLFRDGRYKCLISENGVFAFERFRDDRKVICCVNASEKPVMLRTGAEYAEFESCKSGREFKVGALKFILLTETHNK